MMVEKPDHSTSLLKGKPAIGEPLSAIRPIANEHESLSQGTGSITLGDRLVQLERELADQKWTIEAINALAFGTASTTGQEFLQSLVQQLSATLRVQYVFVTEWVPGRTDRLRSVAGWCGDRAADPIEYELLHAPCQKVLQEGEVFFPRHVQQLFPQDEYLVSHGIESYVGTTLFNSARQPSGHLCIMDRRPFVFEYNQGRAIIKAFAERAGAELERLRAEESLRRREEWFRVLYDGNPSMYFTLSPEGTVLSVNAFGASQLGYTPDELNGRSVLAIFDPADHETVLAQLQQCAGHPHQMFEWEIGKIRKDRSCLLVHERARAIHDRTGRLLVLVACEDITVQKAAEQETRTTTQALRTLIHLSPVAIMALAPDGETVTRWNQAAEIMFGWRADEVLGRPVPFLSSNQRAESDRLWNMLLREERLSGVELRRTRRDGTPIDFALWATVQKDASGVVIGTLGFVVDMTERNRAEVALRESENRLQRFVANAPVGLAILDENRRVILANKALCELTGYAESEILGNTYALYTHPDDLPANLALTDQFYRGERSEYTYEKRYIRKSGEIIWVSVKCVRVDLSGHPGPLLLATVQDITEQKLATEERERLSRDLHDNTLQSLYAVGMQMEATKMSMEKSPRRSKTYMAQAINQLNGLILDVRQFIMLLTKRGAAQPDLGQALRQLVASVSTASQAAPELQIEESALSLITQAQGEQLLNIAREALSNSMRHAHATRRSVQLSHTKNRIRLAISDNGVGFATKQLYPHGHGLANMAARAKNLLARLTIDSAPGKGTRLTVVIPRDKGAVHAKV